MLIKGIALGFSFFYLYEIKIETQRIVDDESNPQDHNQLEVLNSILSNYMLMKIINLMTMVYIIFSYIYRFLKHLKHKNKIKNKYNKVNSNDSGEIQMNLSQYDTELMHINQKKI